ncbi:DsbA family oxidoreductase [Knoellia aerolata]|uniref:DSBA-like thioredoxin domain-containing protein n=1 Tax=Knoellia aerolata DSM 18566 TaxID=1385519 RepID=A0A0A0JXC2_9MICO|nr:DsbA family protein [Knoellia aerolata]KGN42070.1 hypothetical protein N801_03280 [Knoellia aerolata DSM 18566]
MADLVLDLWGDVTDPWSYAAKRRLEAAVAASERPADVVIHHHALPGAALSADDFEQAAVRTRPDGLDISLSEPPSADTTDAHRLVALGHELGGPALQSAMLERLYAAVFREALDVESHHVLQRLAGEAGLDEHRVSEVLASSAFAEQVAADADAARAAGITGPPHLLVDGQIHCAGPVEVEDYLALIHRAAAV